MSADKLEGPVCDLDKTPNCVRLLLLAYAKAELSEGMDWDDLDAAYEAAVEEFPEAAKQAQLDAEEE